MCIRDRLCATLRRAAPAAPSLHSVWLGRCSCGAAWLCSPWPSGVAWPPVAAPGAPPSTL
eukprot:2388335-Alexandrium_andersonii.AAC.1